MKKLIILFAASLFLFSCATTKNTPTKNTEPNFLNLVNSNPAKIVPENKDNFENYYYSQKLYYEITPGNYKWVTVHDLENYEYNDSGLLLKKRFIF